MKKLVSIIALIAFFCPGVRAQVFVLNDNILTQRMGEIRASVVDSLTNEFVQPSISVIPYLLITESLSWCMYFVELSFDSNPGM